MWKGIAYWLKLVLTIRCKGVKHENKRSETACIVLTRYFVYGPGCSYFDENVVANTVGILSMIAVSTTKNNVIVQRNIKKKNPIFIWYRLTVGRHRCQWPVVHWKRDDAKPLVEPEPRLLLKSFWNVLEGVLTRGNRSCVAPTLVLSRRVQTSPASLGVLA